MSKTFHIHIDNSSTKKVDLICTLLTFYYSDLEHVRHGGDLYVYERKIWNVAQIEVLLQGRIDNVHVTEVNPNPLGLPPCVIDLLWRTTTLVDGVPFLSDAVTPTSGKQPERKGTTQPTAIVYRLDSYRK